MNIIRISRNVTIIAFLLSLLFHISSIFYIFSHKTRNFIFPSTQENELIEQNTLLPEQQQEQEKKNNPWVETRARAGNFGAPVFFEDRPEHTLGEEAQDGEKTGFLAKENEPTEEISDNYVQQQEELPEPVIEEVVAQAETLLPLISEKTLETNSKERVEEHSRALEDILFNPTSTNVSAGCPAEEKRKLGLAVELEKNQPRTRDTNPRINSKKEAKQTTKKISPSPSSTPALSTQKPPITLAQLTQGFLHQRKEQSGSYGISMLGIKRGIPSEEQMRYERYLQKLVWCLQNSFNINRHKQPAVLSDSPVHVFFSLNRDGILQHLSIKKSSGNMYIDQFVLFIFQDASSSFPPVPSYLTDNPFSMTCVVS